MDDTFYAVSGFSLIAILTLGVISLTLDAKTNRNEFKTLKNILAATGIILIVVLVFLGSAHCEYQSRQYLEAILSN